MPRSMTVRRRGSAQKRHPAMLGPPPAKGSVHPIARHQVLQMVDALEARPLAIVDDETRDPIGGVELLGRPPGIPPGLELRQEPMNLAEVDPIAPRIGPTVFGVLDTGAGNDVLDDLRQLPDPIVLLRLADVERLVVN